MHVVRRSLRVLAAAGLLFGFAAPAPARAQAPPPDPFLGVSVLTTGAAAPGDPVVVTNSADKTTFGLTEAALTATNQVTGYDDSVLDPIKNFTATPFSFNVTAVNGSAALLGTQVSAHRVDENGNTIAGAGGTFTVNADGTFSFARGSDFADLDAPGDEARVAIDYSLHGANSSNGQTKSFTGTLYVVLHVQPDRSILETPMADFPDFGSSTFPQTQGKAFPDLDTFVHDLLRFEFAGNASSPLNVTNTGNLTTNGLGNPLPNAVVQPYGISATTIGARGYDGRDASITHSSTDGEPGGVGGTITLKSTGNITTNGAGAVGIFAWSAGGDGGQGGDSGYTRNAKAGGPAGTGGEVDVTGSGAIKTQRDDASGILALSQGGNGGGGGDGSTFNGAENGANGGRGGAVNVNGAWQIETHGNNAYGIWAKSFGGQAGSGGDGGWTGTSSGDGGFGTEGGNVHVTFGATGSILTRGNDAYGLFGQSIGGFGGDGGSGASIFYATGGSGAKAGSGGSVTIDNAGSITTSGLRSHGIFAESVGGGGGTGGSGSALAGLGGSGAGGGDAGAVRVNNSGVILTNGAGARGIYAQSVGGGGGDGGDGAGLVGVGGSGSATSDGSTVAVENTGTISSSSSAIYAQSIGGGGGDGGSAAGLISVGGNGGAGGDSDVVTVSSHGNLTTIAHDNATAVFAQSVGGGGGNGGNSVAVGVGVAAAIGGRGGVGGKGSDVRVGVDADTYAIDPVTGSIVTLGDNSHGIQAQSIGGGGGNGGFAFAGSFSPGASASLAMGGDGGNGNIAKDVSVYFGDNASAISTSGANSNGLFAQSVGGGGGNGGLSIAAAASTGVAVGLTIGGGGGSGADAGTVTTGDAQHPLEGLILTSGDHSYGLLAQSIGGGGGNGGLAVSVAVSAKGSGALAIGGNGGAAGKGAAVNVTSDAGIVTAGDNSHALFAQSVGGGGGSGGGSIGAGISGGNSLELTLGGRGAGGGDAGDITLNNGGLLFTFGDKSYGLLAQSVGGGGGDGGFAISGGISGGNDVNVGVGGGGGTASNSGLVTMTNSGNILTEGDDSHALFVQSAGGGGGSGGFSVAGGIAKSGAFSAAVGGVGGAGGNGNNVSITNLAASFQTMGDRAYGILAQSIGGGGGDGGFAVAGGISQSNSVDLGIGGAGAAGGHAGTVYLNSTASITTSGELAHGIFAQSVGGGGGSGGFAISGGVTTQNAMTVSIGGSGGSASYADHVTVINTGTIRTGGSDGSGQGSYGILAQSIGGGGGDGGFSGAFTGTFGGQKKGKSLSLSIGGSGGTGGDGGVVDLTNGGLIFTTANDSVGLYAQSVGGGGGSGGFGMDASLSTSADSYDLGVAIGGSGHAAGNAKNVTVTNSSGIQTLGDHSLGIQAQSIGGGGGNGGFAVSATGGTGKQTRSASAAVGGTAGAGGNALDVTVNNDAAISTAGDDAAGIQAQSLGGGGGNGGFAIGGTLSGDGGKSLSIALGGDGGSGGTAGKVDVLGTGGYTISTLGARSVGVQAMSVGGGGGNGGFSAAVSLGEGGNQPGKGSTALSISVGGDGGGGDTAGAVSVGSYVNGALVANITTAGQEAVGIQAESLGGGGGNGGMSYAGAINAVPSDKAPNTDAVFSVGGGGGNGDNASSVLVRHVGDIFTSGDGAHGIEAQSIGGGGGNAGGAQALALQLGPKPPVVDESKLTDAEKKQRIDDKKKAGSNKSLSVSIGGHGGGASNGSTVTVGHTGDIMTLGGDAHGIFAQSIGGGGGSGGDADSGLPDINNLPLLDVLKQRLDRSKKAYSGKDVSIIVGGSGGSSGNGDAVLVKNTGVITTFGDNSHGVFAQSIGGGGGAGGSGELGLSGTVGVGGGTGSTGNGGTVDVQIAGAVNTFGDGSHAIFAQSIGGGGGQSGNVDRGLKNYANIGFGLAFGQGGGNGGDGHAVTVTSTANLTTYGVGSNGIFAQSIGGGGGVAGDLGNDLPLLSMTSFAGSVGGTGSADVLRVTQTGDITTFGDASDGIFAQSAGGQQTGKAVTVTLNSGDIVTAGAESNGIFAQSTGQGGRDDITVTIADAHSVVMGGSHTGAAVRFADGATNLLTNHGAISTVDGLSGTPIVGTTGNETIANFGTVTGSIDLGAGTNVFDNASSGLFITGEHVALGSASTLINAGTLSSGDWGHVQTTTVDGKMTQTGTPVWLVDLGAGGTSDRLAMTGAAQFGSSVTRLDLNPLSMPAGSSSFTLATAASGLGNATFTFGTYYGDLPIGQTFNTVASDRDVQLTVTPSTGLFRWTGLTGSSWTTPFVDGVSNWTSDANGQTFVYGTPGVATDVLVGPRSGVSFLGGNFAVNSLHFDNVAPGTGLGDTMIGGGALTIAAKDGKGMTIDRGVSSTTLDVDLALGNSQTWTNDGSLLAIVGDSISGSGRDLTIAGVGQTYIDASIDTGGGSLTKDGDGTLVLGGRNSYSGGTFVKNGMIAGSARSLQGAIANDAIVVFDQPDAGEYAGVMSGTGLFVKQGAGALTLSGANTYTGGTYAAAGALQGTTASLQGNILNLGSLIFDQTGAGTYAGSLAGTGSLLLRGGGSYVFSGNSGTFTGQTTVSGSKLSVNGWLGGGTVFVPSGATVGGVGIVPTVRVQSGGTLAPGNSIGTLSITGSATFETGSHYQVETEAYGSSDQMVVMGSVLGAGGTVDVHAGGARRYRPINRYTIAQFGGSVIPFAGVTSNVAYLVPSLRYEPNRVLLTLRRNDVDFRAAGTQGNETPVADVFNALVATADGTMADSINSVYDLADADIRNAFRTMGGIIYQHAARSGLATAQAFTALGMKRLDLTSGDAVSGGVSADVSRDNLHLAGADASFVRSDDASPASRGFWLSGLGGVAQYAGSAGSASARTRLLGVAGGLDIEPVHGLTLGVVGGRATPEIHLDAANDRASSTTTQAGGYGRVALGASRVDAAVSFGGSRNEVWRVVTDGTILPTAHASFNGAAMSSQLDYAYGMRIGRSVLVEPQVGYHYGRLSLEGATETGADVLDLLVPDRVVTSNQVTAGARVVKALGGEVTKWTLEGRAAWLRELTPLASMRMRFAGDLTTDGFLLAAPSPRRDGAIVGVSIAGAWAKGLRIALDVDGQTGGPISGWSSNVSLDKRW